MIVNGTYVPNITCPHCAQRHPTLYTCAEARLMAENGRLRERILEIDSLHATLLSRISELEQKVESLEYDIMEMGARDGD